MDYILIIIAIITLTLHYHYYRWGVLTNRINYPRAYRSRFGVSVVIISKLVLFTIIFLFYDWYYVLVLIVVFFILKLAVGYISIFYETGEYAKSLGVDKKEAREVASQEIKGYYRKSSKLI